MQVCSDNSNAVVQGFLRVCMVSLRGFDLRGAVYNNSVALVAGWLAEEATLQSLNNCYQSA